MAKLKQLEEFVHFSKYRIVQYLQVCVLVDVLVGMPFNSKISPKQSSVCLCMLKVNSTLSVNLSFLEVLK